MKKNRVCLYYLFEDAVRQNGTQDCIWSREGCYNWNEAYEIVNQYADWYLSLGVKPHDYVSFYMMNSPDFIFAWLGLWYVINCFACKPACFPRAATEDGRPRIDTATAGLSVPLRR